MTGERTVTIDGTPYTVTISSEQEVLSAAYAAGGAVLGLWDKNRAGQCLSPAGYAVECMEDADSGLLERVVRRRFHMPWIIGETERLLIRELTEDDAAAMAAEEAGPGEGIFSGGEALEAYINCQYRFFEYGIWALVEKKSGTVIGTAGLFQPEWLSEEEDGASDEKEDIPLELGYRIFPPWRRSGYAKEACREILNYGAVRLTGRVYAAIDCNNTASVRLAESLGFRLTSRRYSGSVGSHCLYEWNCP